MSALTGRMVLVTRAQAQAPELRAALEATGARTLVFPTIEIHPVLDNAVVEAVALLDRIDWIAFTSANAVNCWWDAMRESGRDTLPAGMRVAAVGPATAAAIQARGVQVTTAPERSIGTALAGAMGALAGQRVLLPAADLAGEDTALAIREAGATVTRVTVYRTRAPRPDPGVRAALEAGVDAATFTSPSTFEGFLATAGDAASPLLVRAVIACLGPVTAEAVRRRGFQVDVEPSVPTIPALVKSLEAHFATTPTPATGCRA